MTLEGATDATSPYRAGDRLFFLFLDGVLRGPFEVIKGPGRFPSPSTCLLRALPETVCEADPALGFEKSYAPGEEAGEFGVFDLWRDVPGLRDLAAAKARAWDVFARGHERVHARLADTPPGEWPLVERGHEDQAAVDEDRRLTDDMSAHHPYRSRKP